MPHMAGVMQAITTRRNAALMAEIAYNSIQSTLIAMLDTPFGSEMVTVMKEINITTWNVDTMEGTAWISGPSIPTVSYIIQI